MAPVPVGEDHRPASSSGLVKMHGGSRVMQERGSKVDKLIRLTLMRSQHEGNQNKKSDMYRVGVKFWQTKCGGPGRGCHALKLAVAALGLVIDTRELLTGVYLFIEGLRHHFLGRSQGTTHRNVLTMPCIGFPSMKICWL